MASDELQQAHQEWLAAFKPIDAHLLTCTICDDLRGEARCAEIEPMFVALELASDRRNRAIDNQRKNK